MEVYRPVKKAKALKGGIWTAGWVLLGGAPWRMKERAVVVVTVYQAVNEARALGVEVDRAAYDRPYTRHPN
jgi:hypothetical protein